MQAGQQLGTFIAGDGIETGFAAAAGSPISTHAAALGQVAQTGGTGANRTYCGQAMSDLIERAGGRGWIRSGHVQLAGALNASRRAVADVHLGVAADSLKLVLFGC